MCNIRMYNDMANEVYLLDTKKGGKYFVGKKLGRAGDSYKILDISRDGTYGKKHEYGSVNHMQAMAVAPVDKKGKVDKSQITIAYAGTNPTDITDLKTDAVYVAGIDRTITKYGHVESSTNSLNQFETALGYADYIQKKFPEAKISVTGHSLGGSLALTVGGKRKLHTVAFNGPIPQKQLTAKERKYIVDNPTMFSNYLNGSDPIGNYNNSYGLAPLKGDFQHYYGKNSFVKMLEKHGVDPSKLGFMDVVGNFLAESLGAVGNLGKEMPLAWLGANALKHHSIESWFDENGRFNYQDEYVPITKAQKRFEKTVVQTDKQLAKRLGAIKTFGKEMASGNGGRIKLDTLTAWALKDAIKAHGQAGITVIKETKKKAERELEDNWNATLNAARRIGTELSEAEILEALREAKADKESLYTRPVEKLDRKLEALKDIQRKLDTYDKTLGERIKKRAADDQELAQRFGL